MKIFTFDTTLRDGTQGEAVSFSVDDKLIIAQKLDELGIDYIEGGWPGSNPKDKEFFAPDRVRIDAFRPQSGGAGPERAGASGGRNAGGFHLRQELDAACHARAGNH